MIIVDDWDNILGHFGHIFGLFGPKIGLFGSKIGLFGSKNGLLGQFFGLFGPKNRPFREKRTNGLFTEFCSPEGHFLCIPVYKYSFLIVKELGQFKLVHLVISAISDILHNSDISDILVL